MAQSGGSLAQRLVVAFDTTFKGPHPGFRANHAKGILCKGSFSPATAAAKLSVASHFHAPVEATVRFSNFGGLPLVPDNSPGAAPHGLAVKFHLEDGSETDLVGHSVAFFPSATPEEFIDFLHALAGGAATLKPYAATHPATAQFIEALKPPPVSFATVPYFYIDAFKFVDSGGKALHVRYSMLPVAAEAYLAPERARKATPNYLLDELTSRLRRGPVEFDYVAQIADASDPTNDPTKYWPAERRHVTLGRLKITAVVADNAAAQRRILFDPARLTKGIELSDDPLVPVRSAAYAISFARRVRQTADATVPAGQRESYAISCPIGHARKDAG